MGTQVQEASSLSTAWAAARRASQGAQLEVSDGVLSLMGRMGVEGVEPDAASFAFAASALARVGDAEGAAGMVETALSLAEAGELPPLLSRGALRKCEGAAASLLQTALLAQGLQQSDKADGGVGVGLGLREERLDVGVGEGVGVGAGNEKGEDAVVDDGGHG